MPCSRTVRLLFAAALAVTLTACQPRSSATPRPEGTALVVRVVDGDTLVLDLNGSSVHARLLGLDTPETVDENRPVQCFGHEASELSRPAVAPGQHRPPRT